MNFFTSREQSTPRAKRRRGLGYIAVGAAACVAGTTSVAVAPPQVTTYDPTALENSNPISTTMTVTPKLWPKDYGTGGNATCAQMGFQNDSSPGQTGGMNWGDPNFFSHFSNLGITVDVTDGTYVGWQSSTWPIDAVVLHGGSVGSNVYLYNSSFGPDTGLAPPLNSNSQPAGLSNLRFCWNAPEYDVSITKTADTPTVDPGGTATWTVTVKNTGADAIPFEMIEVSDTDADSLTPIGTTPDRLAPGDSFSWTASKKVSNDPDLCGTEILNSASVSLKDYDTKTTDDESTPNIPITVDGEVCVPDVSIAKTADEPTVDPGGTATWTVTVTNSGQVPVPFTDIDVTDTDADTLEKIGTPPDSLAPGASFSWKASKAVENNVDLCGTEILNSASVTLKGSATPTPGDDSTGNIPITVDGEVCAPEYNVAIQKSSNSATVEPGGTATWTVTVTSTGKDPIPFGLIQVSDPNADSLTPIGTPPAELAPGASFSWTASRQIAASTDTCGAEILNSASVTLVGSGFSFTPEADDQAVATAIAVQGVICDPPPPPPPPAPPEVTAFRPATGGLSIKKTGSKRAVVGGRVTYTIVVRNTGATDATGVVLRDIAPGVFAWGRKASGATLKGRTMTWAIGTIPAGGKVTKKVTLLVKMTSAKRACNVAQVTSANAGRYRSKACTKLSVAMRPATPVTG